MNEANLTEEEKRLIASYRRRSPEQKRHVQSLMTRMLTRQIDQGQGPATPSSEAVINDEK